MEKWYSHSDPTQIRIAYSHLTHFRFICENNFWHFADTVIKHFIFITPHMPHTVNIATNNRDNWNSILKTWESSIYLADKTWFLKLNWITFMDSKCKYMRERVWDYTCSNWNRFSSKLSTLFIVRQWCHSLSSSCYLTERHCLHCSCGLHLSCIGGMRPTWYSHAVWTVRLFVAWIFSLHCSNTSWIFLL